MIMTEQSLGAYGQPRCSKCCKFTKQIGLCDNCVLNFELELFGLSEQDLNDLQLYFVGIKGDIFQNTLKYENGEYVLHRTPIYVHQYARYRGYSTYTKKEMVEFLSRDRVFFNHGDAFIHMCNNYCIKYDVKYLKYFVQLPADELKDKAESVKNWFIWKE